MLLVADGLQNQALRSVLSIELRDIPLLRDMPATSLELLVPLMVHRSYEHGELIFLEGDPSHGIWFIIKGRVQIIKMSMMGRVQALCIAKQGKCFGGCPLFDMEANPANAQAVGAVELLILPQEAIKRIESEQPELLHTLLKIYSERLSLLAALSERLGVWGVGARINDCLLSHAIDSGSNYVVRLTHEKIAELVGTVREVVTRHLNQLERKDILHQESGQIVIHDLEFLETDCILNN